VQNGKLHQNADSLGNLPDFRNYVTLRKSSGNERQFAYHYVRIGYS